MSLVTMPVKIWHDLAKAGDLKTKWARENFALSEAKMLEMEEAESEQLNNQGLDRMAVRAFLDMRPLLLERAAIARYVKKHPELAGALVEVNSVDEAIWIVNRDWPLDQKAEQQARQLLHQALKEEEEPGQSAPAQDQTELGEISAMFDEELATMSRSHKESSLDRQRQVDEAIKKMVAQGVPLAQARERAVAGAKKIASSTQGILDVLSKYGGLSVREVKSEDNLNQDLYTELLPHLREVAQGARELGRAGKDLGREVIRYLMKTFGNRAAQAKPYFMKFVDEELLNPGDGNVAGDHAREDLARSGQGRESEDKVGQGELLPERGQDAGDRGSRVRAAEKSGSKQHGRAGLPGHVAPAPGEGSHSPVREEASEVGRSLDGGEIRGRSYLDSESRLPSWTDRPRLRLGSW